MVGAQALVLAAMQGSSDGDGSWRLEAAGGGSAGSRPNAAAVGAAVPGVKAGTRHKGKAAVSKRMQQQVSMLTHT